MTHNESHDAVRPGDVLQARGVHGEAARSGEVIEVLGRPAHRRFRVRWEDDHESIVYPADGVTLHRPHHNSAT